MNIFLSSDDLSPTISFISPSPLEGSVVNASPIVNVSISDAGNQTYSFFNDGLVLWMRLNNESGENATFFKDWSGLGNNGTCSGTTCPTFNASGKFGGTQRFDGVDDYIINSSSTASLETTTNSFTYSAWIKTNSPINNFNGVIGLKQSNTAKQSYIYLNPGGSIGCRFDTTSSSFLCSTVGNTSDLLWHHVALIYNGSTATLYFDRINSSGTNILGILNYTSPLFQVGKRVGASEIFNGSIDEVMIFNRSLSATEIQALYNSSQYYLQRGYTGLSGVQNITATSVDDSGNVNTSSLTFTADAIFPGVSFTGATPANGTNQNWNSIFVNVSSNDTYEHYSFVDFDNSLVGYWRLERGNGTFFADDTGRNNGTCSGTTCPVFNASGKFGGDYEFDGINDSITLPRAGTSNILNLSSQPFTLAAWWKPASFSSEKIILGRLGFNSGLLSSSNGFYFEIRNTSAASPIAITGSCSGVGNWCHGVAVFNTTNAFLYINGVLVGSGNWSSGNVHSTPSSNPLTIGGNTGWYSNGSIDEVMVFNRSLSASEIGALYNASAIKYYNNFTSLGDGGHTFTAYAVDSAGNKNSTDQRIITVDTTSPNGTLLAPPSGTYSNTGTVNLTANLSDSNGIRNASLNIYNSSGALINITWITDFVGNVVNRVVGVVVGLADGVYTWFYQVFDLAGNSFTTANGTLIIDTTYPTVNFTSPTPANNTGRSSNFIINASIFDINLANVTLNWNGTLKIFNTTNESIADLGNGNYIFTYNQTGLVVGVSYYYNITIVDLAGNSNASETRIVKGNSDPAIVSVSINPGSDDDIDPNVTLTFEVNASDTDSNIDSLILRAGKQNETLNNYTLMNTSEKGIYTIYNISFTPEEESNYTFRIIANDTENALAFYETNISVFYDYSWNASIGFSAVTGRYSQNKYIGNITINNTGDYNLTVDYITDNSPYPTGLGLKYDGMYYVYPSFIIASNQSSKGSRNILINATFSPTNRSDVVAITLAAGAANPVSKILNFSLVSFAGGPYFDMVIDNYNERVNQSSNFSLGGYVSNIGDSQAYNISLNWTLPSSFGIIGGNLSSFMVNLSSREQSPFYTNRSDMNISINSQVTAGEYTVYLSATGSNETGIADETNKTTSKKITVYCSITDGVCGAGCSYLSNTTFYDSDCSAPSTGSTDSTGGGGGGGGVGDKSLSEKSSATFELVRGKDKEFSFEIRNKYSFIMRNITIKASGTNAKYVELLPATIYSLEPGAVQNITVRISAPGYFSQGNYTIYFDISGDLVSNQTITRVYEKKATTLIILEYSRDEAKEAIDLINSMFDEMNASALNLDSISLLKKSAQEAFSRDDFVKLKEIVNEAKIIRDNAFESKSIIDSLNEEIAASEKKGINIIETKKILYLAEILFNRGDYALALEKLKEARLTYALEVKGEYNLLYTIKNNPGKSTGAALAVLLLSFGSTYLVRLRLYRSKRRILIEEEKLLLELMKVVQRECFEKNSLSMEEYNEAMKQYEMRLSETIEDRIRVESRIANLLKVQGKKKALNEEKQKITILVKKLQEDYLVHGEIETRVYENMLKSYSKRIAEVEEQLAFLDAQKALTADSIFSHALRKMGMKR